MEGQTEQMAGFGSPFALVLRSRRKRGSLIGHEGMAPQDDAQKVQVRRAPDSGGASDAGGVSLVLSEYLNREEAL